MDTVTVCAGMLGTAAASSPGARGTIRTGVREGTTQTGWNVRGRWGGGGRGGRVDAGGTGRVRGVTIRTPGTS